MSRKRAFAVAAVVVLGGALAAARALSPNTSPAGGDPPAADDGTAVKPRPAPELPADAEWVQGGPLKLADLRGRVAVVHFWTNGCVNCVHNYPAYRAWQAKYDPKQVTIVGVHTPEFDWEAPAKRVKEKAKANGLKFPVVLDPDAKVWKAWGNRYWPAVYLVDKKGQVRYAWEGELHLDTAAGKRFAAHIDELLAEK